MQMIHTWIRGILLIAGLLAISSCEEIIPIEILNADNNILNPSVEEGTSLPTNWVYSEGDTVAVRDGLWVSGDGYDSNRSLKITLNSEEIEFIYWGQVRTARPLANKPLILKAMVKAVGLQGQGAALILRGDHTSIPKGESESLASSQEITKIIGSHDWTEYQVVLSEGMDRKTESVSVSLAMLPETTGTVFFDEISLSYQE